MHELRERLHRDLDGIGTTPPPVDRVRHRAERRERWRRARAGVLGTAVAVAVIAGAWALAERNRTPDPDPPATPPAPTRLFLAGDGEGWVVDATHQTARHLSMPELPPGDAPHRVVRRGDGLVAWAYETLLLRPGDDPATEVLVPDSLFFIPSSEPDRVWVAIEDESRDDAGLSAVREVSIDGEVTVPDTRPPGGAWPLAAVSGNLVFQRQGELVVWNPATREEIDRLPGSFPLAWAGDLLAWCDDRCDQLLVTDVASGETSTVDPPDGAAGFEAFRGAFSPDRGTLAVAVRLGPGPEADRRLALVDLDTNRTTLVAGATVSTPYIFVDWAPSGDIVFIAGGQDAGDRQLVAYRIGDPTATVLDVTVGSFYDMSAYQAQE